MKPDAYSVIVVEDEAIALQYICTAIEERLVGFRVIATAEDGASALALIERKRPDLVVTDIHMPVMDGVTLLSRLEASYPELCTLVISGYRDFDLVKGALLHGAVDYILKPISPAKLSKAFAAVKRKLDGVHRREQLLVLKRLANGESVDPSQLVRMFPDSPFCMAVHRKNGLPRRFAHSLSFLDSVWEGSLLQFSGRDGRERIFLSPVGEEPEAVIGFRHLVLERLSAGDDDGDPAFHTLVVQASPFSLIDLPDTLKRLFEVLDRNIVIGRSRMLDTEKALPSSDPLDPRILRRLEMQLAENKFAAFRQDLSGILDAWNREGKTQLWLENAVGQILQMMVALSPEMYRKNAYGILLDEAFGDVASFDALKSRLLALIQQKFLDEYGTFAKIDTPEFFARVTAYIDRHYAENLGLSDICTTFGISQAYLSKLFRKYADSSYNGYLRTVRLQKAQALMKSSPDLQVREIALLSGFRDQYYFSRLFVRETGKTPSRYLALCREDR